MLFTLRFGYLDLTERHFSSDIFVPFPDLSDLCYRVVFVIHQVFAQNYPHKQKECIICIASKLKVTVENKQINISVNINYK